MGSLPDGGEVIGCGIDQRRHVGEDAGLEIAVVVAFHTNAGTCKVGGADVGDGAVENHYLEMHPWAEPPLQPAPQSGILVEILAEVLLVLWHEAAAHRHHVSATCRAPTKTAPHPDHHPHTNPSGRPNQSTGRA